MAEIFSINILWFKSNFRPHFNDWIFGPINRLVISEDALIGFIFMACTIDYLSGFWYGGDTTGHVIETYRGFIDTYFRPDRYNSLELYKSLRNGLVHMFTIRDSIYGLTHNDPGSHLKKDTEGHILLNAGDFRDDLWYATNKYFDEVETNDELLNKLMKRYADHGFLYLGKSKIE